VTERFVLHASAALIELLVRELYQVERIGDLDRVGKHRVEHRPIRSRQIQRRVFDSREPFVATRLEPPPRSRAELGESPDVDLGQKPPRRSGHRHKM
jgi:hypothetical protein